MGLFSNPNLSLDQTIHIIQHNMETLLTTDRDSRTLEFTLQSHRMLPHLFHNKLCDLVFPRNIIMNIFGMSVERVICFIVGIPSPSMTSPCITRWIRSMRNKTRKNKSMCKYYNVYINFLSKFTYLNKMCSLKVPSESSTSACTLCVLETSSSIPSLSSECI